MPDPTTTTTTVATPTATLTTTDTKPGYKTTEFYLTVLANLVGLLLLADVFAPGSGLGKILGAASIVLSNLGYKAARAYVKTSAMLLVFGLGLSLATSSMGCKPYLPPAAGPIVDCITANRPGIDSLISSFWPKDGNAPNWSSVESQAISAGETVGGCALSEFVQKYLTPAPGNHAPAPELAKQARSTLDSFRTQHANGATFRTQLGDL